MFRMKLVEKCKEKITKGQESYEKTEYGSPPAFVLRVKVK